MGLFQEIIIIVLITKLFRKIVCILGIEK
jgi:hypothetical protein